MKVVRYLLASVLILMLTVVFYVAVVLGMPQETEQSDQSLPAASASVTVVSPQSVVFPARVLTLTDGSGWQFAGGSCYDMTFENGVARIAALQWQNGSGESLTCTTIYPARAVSLMNDGSFSLASGTPVSVAGMSMICLAGAQGIRLQATGDDAAWMMTLPAMEQEALSELLRYAILLTPDT